MKLPVKRVLLGAATAGLLTLALAPQAAAYPVGPLGVEGSCRGLEPNQCPASPSQDGLTWSYRGQANNYDKFGNFVCGTFSPADHLYCDPLMALVRALPPQPIGQWLHPSS